MCFYIIVQNEQRAGVKKSVRAVTMALHLVSVVFTPARRLHRDAGVALALMGRRGPDVYLSR
jgi:hypothetical protein